MNSWVSLGLFTSHFPLNKGISSWILHRFHFMMIQWEFIIKKCCWLREFWKFEPKPVFHCEFKIIAIILPIEKGELLLHLSKNSFIFIILFTEKVVSLFRELSYDISTFQLTKWVFEPRWIYNSLQQNLLQIQLTNQKVLLCEDPQPKMHCESIGNWIQYWLRNGFWKSPAFHFVRFGIMKYNLNLVFTNIITYSTFSKLLRYTVFIFLHSRQLGNYLSNQLWYFIHFLLCWTLTSSYWLQKTSWANSDLLEVYLNFFPLIIVDITVSFLYNMLWN